MAPMFDALGVQVIALSRDDVDQARRMHREDSLGDLTLLADPELEVIGKFGLVHHKKALATTSPIFRVFGLPIGIPRGFEQMAIPTTLLIDAQGIVRWIDQADDYRVRSDVARVDAALREVFGPPAPSAPSPPP